MTSDPRFASCGVEIVPSLTGGSAASPPGNREIGNTDRGGGPRPLLPESCRRLSWPDT